MSVFCRIEYCRLFLAFQSCLSSVSLLVRTHPADPAPMMMWLNSWEVEATTVDVEKALAVVGENEEAGGGNPKPWLKADPWAILAKPRVVTWANVKMKYNKSYFCLLNFLVATYLVYPGSVGLFWLFWWDDHVHALLDIIHNDIGIGKVMLVAHAGQHTHSQTQFGLE